MVIANFKKQKRTLHIAVVLLAVFMSSCAFAPWEQKKSQQLSPEASVSEAEKQLRDNPDSIKLHKNLHIVKEAAVNNLLREADLAQAKNDAAAAKVFFERVLSFAPKNQTALTGIVNIERALKQYKKIETASQFVDKNQLEAADSEIQSLLVDNPKNKMAQSLKESIDEKAGVNQQQAIKLKTNYDKPISLELRDANVKFVFEALSHSTGINFIIDKDVKPDTKLNIFIKNMPIEQAIDMIISSNGFQKKILSENTVFVYANTAQKRKDFQDLKVRSFYLNNINAKEVSSMLKTILKVKDVYIEERLNVLVLRDTPEVIHLAEKLVSVVDVADSEVMLEIEVLEVSRSRLQELGITYPNQFSVIGASTGLTLEALKNISSSSIGVSPNPAINFKKTVGDVNLLSNPRIRVKNNEKAKILVGDKVPIITTTSTANVGVSENVTYVDVGLKLEVEPKINLENFVSIKVGLEVSSLGDKTVTKNGATVYTIGTRNANTLLRLKDGETQILAGLILDDERKNASRLPGLGDIPLVGRLFSNQEDKKSKTEIVLAITPRILSNLQLPKAELFDFWSGTDDQISDSPRKFSPQVPSVNRSNFPEPLNQLVPPPLERLQEQRSQRQLEIEAQQENNNNPKSELDNVIMQEMKPSTSVENIQKSAQ